MPKPIYATEDMIEKTFGNIRKEFEEQFEKAKATAATKKMADGNLDFKFTKFNWSWEKDGEPARAKLTITPEAFSKIMLTVLSTDKEIGWHGTIERDAEDETNFVLKNIIFFPQEVTSATVVADEAAYPIWALKLPEETFNEMRFHGHSHVNMATSPSPTDMTYRADLIHQFKDGFYVFLIINKKLETNCQIYDFDNNMLYSNSEVEINVGNEYVQEIAAATKEMVKSKTYNYGGHGYGGNGYQGGVYTGKGVGKTPALPTAKGNTKGKGSEDYRYYDDDDDYGYGESWWHRQFPESQR